MVEDAYANGEIFEITSTDHSENDLQKPGAENRPRLGHLSTGPDQTTQGRKEIQFQGQEKVQAEWTYSVH